MYYSRLLSKQTLGAVIAAAPDANFTVTSLARSVLAVLRHEMAEPLHCRIFNTGGDTTYTMKVGLIAELIDGGPTAHLVGRVMREMGLESRRISIGYIVEWSDKQLDILQDAMSGGSASSIPCARCGGAVVEFSIPNDIWNEIIREDGHEHDGEYLCWNCFWNATRVKLAEYRSSGPVSHD